MTPIAIDIIQDPGKPPVIAYPSEAFPKRPVFAAVVPPGGTEEEARLFAVCYLTRPDADVPLFHEGARPDARPVTSHVLETLDPDSVPRLFERGDHPGDFEIAGLPPDRYGRPEIAVLTFFRLTERGLGAGTRLSTPVELRLGLAEACADLDATLGGGTAWAKAADAFDPAGLMREGVIAPKGGNPMTAENFDDYMREGARQADAGMDVPANPIQDYRLLTTDEIAFELEADARAILAGCPHIGAAHPTRTLLGALVPRLAASLRTGTPDGAAALAAARAGLADAVAAADQDRATGNLVRGVGPGAVCWRNITDPRGLVAMAARRMADPECDAATVAAVQGLSAWARRAFHNVRAVLHHRPPTVRHLKGALNDQHRPFLAMPARRLAVAPEVEAALAGLTTQRLAMVVRGTEALFEAFRAIPNAHPDAAEARDALAIGWRLLAAEAQERGLDGVTLDPDAAAFVTPAAQRLPYLAALGPRRTGAAPGPR